MYHVLFEVVSLSHFADICIPRLVNNVKEERKEGSEGNTEGEFSVECFVQESRLMNFVK